MTAAQTKGAVNRSVTAPTCAVRLIDRRTGSVHRVNGAPLVLFARDPADAAAELMRDRNADHWEIRIEPIPAGGIQ
jgi:hypothetical protein